MKGKDKCIIENCEGLEFGRKWCEKHYRRWLRHGDPMITKKRGRKFKVKESDSRDAQERPGSAGV